jgi:hypothetical protein
MLWNFDIFINLQLLKIIYDTLRIRVKYYKRSVDVCM